MTDTKIHQSGMYVRDYSKKPYVEAKQR
jgi:hypothetical protein